MSNNWNNNQGGFNPNPTNSTNQAMNTNAYNPGMNTNAYNPGMNTNAMNQNAFNPGMNTNAYNPGMNTNAMNNMAANLANYSNPHNLTIPTIQYVGGCNKCHGSGIVNRKGHNYPCRRCYKRSGYCMYCYGSRTLFQTGQPCTYCQNGQYMKRQKSHGHGHHGHHGHSHDHGHHSSSSDSDW